MNSNDYPRILIITSTSMNDISQTGITLHNVWKKWPKDKIMEFIVGETTHNHRRKYDTALSYNLPNSRRPFAWLCRIKCVWKLNAKLKNGVSDTKSEENNLITVKEKIRQLIYALNDVSMVILHRKDFAVIERYSPDVIYTMGSSVTLLKLSYRISKHQKKYILIHFMDNWPECMQWQDNRLLTWYRSCLDRWLKRSYSRSSCALTISHEMANQYERRTGVKHIALLNAITVDSFICHNTKDKYINTVNLIYAGGLHVGRDKILYKIAEKIDAVSKLTRKEYRLTIYTASKESPYINKIRKFNKAYIYPAVPHEEIKEIYEKASILLLVETLESGTVNAEFAKYSISTKTAEYLASGRPIIYVGSVDKTLTRYLNNNDAAFVVTEETQLIQAMIDATTHHADRVVRNALRLANKYHDSNNVNQIILKAIGEGGGLENKN